MQIFVYESYTRLVDATTDAIHSIGTKLTTGIQAVDEKSRAMEEALGSLRDQVVAETIRDTRCIVDIATNVQGTNCCRQVSNDDQELRTSLYNPRRFLGKHWERFDESAEYLPEMKWDLYHKLLHWSGHRSEFADDDEDPGTRTQPTNIPHPPKSMTAIFECTYRNAPHATALVRLLLN